MWKKDEAPEPAMVTRPDPPTASPMPAPAPLRTTTPAVPSAERATIGRSISIRGDVTGDEDLLIQGRIEGSVDLKQHSVTVGKEGEVKANIAGRVIAVEGRVEGNLRADDQVVLRSSAVVQGDIVAPRVVLEDGARFRGGVDMGEPAKGNVGKPTQAPAPARVETAAPPAQDKPVTAGKGNGGAQKAAEINA